MEPFFSPILRCSPKKKKKKVLRLSSATFLRDFCDIPERGAMNRGCLRFLVGNKNAGFWREKKRRNSQNFSAKMPEKISHFSHFFALIGNTEYTVVYQAESSVKSVSCGVPHGSTLGPLLFLIYINDLPNACNLRIRLFADDASLTMSNNSKSLLENYMNNELIKVDKWLKTS